MKKIAQTQDKASSSLVIKKLLSPKSAYAMANIEVRPTEQPHVSLGEYTSSETPIGFALYIEPDPEPDAIVAQIMRVGSTKSYELVLHVANYGNKTVNVEVWPL